MAASTSALPAWQHGLDLPASWLAQLVHRAFGEAFTMWYGAPPATLLLVVLLVCVLVGLAVWGCVYARGGRHKCQRYEVLTHSRPNMSRSASVEGSDSWRDEWPGGDRAAKQSRGEAAGAGPVLPGAPPEAAAAMGCAREDVRAAARTPLALAQNVRSAQFESAAPTMTESPAARYSPLELPLAPGASTSACHSYAPLAASRFSVRSRTYLTTGKKLPSEEASELLSVELFSADRAVPAAACRAGAPSHTLQARTATLLSSIFAVSLVLPSPSGIYQLVLYFGMRADAAHGPAHELLQAFAGGTDAFRSSRLKLLPAVAVGPWLVQKAVGTRPAILGKVLKQRFHTGETAGGLPAPQLPGMQMADAASSGVPPAGRALPAAGCGPLPILEACVDCNSSPAAGRIVSLVKSYARSLVVDLAFTLEPQRAAEMPERVLGCARLCRIDLDEGQIPAFREGIGHAGTCTL